MNRHFQLITFDLDDTLWPVAPVITAAERITWQWLCEHYPRIRDHFDPETLMALRLRLMETDHLKHRISAIRIQAMSQALRRSGYVPHVAERGANDAFETFLHARHEVAFFDQAIETLEQLAAHYTLGVLTNGNACIHRLGLGHVFGFAFSAEHFQASKPDPALFLAALEHAGCDANQCIHIGDHPTYDIAPAKALGMRTIWVNTEHKPWPDQAPADHEVRSLPELLTAVQQLEAAV